MSLFGEERSDLHFWIMKSRNKQFVVCNSAFKFLSLFALSIGFLCSCSDVSSVDAPVRIDLRILSGENALAEVAGFVAVGPRVSGTEGSRRASAFLVQRLKDEGLEVEVDEFTEEVNGEEIVFRNVLVTLSAGVRESGGMVVLASHYDTKGGIDDRFAGANDSGSSTGLLIELAKVLKSVPNLPYDVLFAFLDGEECRIRYSNEDGLHGSRRLAAGLKRDKRADSVLAVVVLDMVGDRDLTVTLPRNCSSEMLGMVFDVSREQGVRSKFELAATAIVDDHVPFINAGMPAVDIIDFHYGSSKGGNEYWHTVEDTMDKLSAESLEVVGRVVLGMLNKLAGL